MELTLVRPTVLVVDESDVSRGNSYSCVAGVGYPCESYTTIESARKRLESLDPVILFIWVDSDEAAQFVVSERALGTRVLAAVKNESLRRIMEQAGAVCFRPGVEISELERLLDQTMVSA